MKRKTLIVLLLVLLPGCMAICGAVKPWGSLTKIQFFGSLGDDQEVVRILDQIDGSSLSRQEKREWIQEMLKLGDTFFIQKKYDLSQAMYTKILDVSSDSWYVFNRLEFVRRAKGSILFSIPYTWKQFLTMTRNFSPSFFMIVGFFYVLFGTFILVFLAFTLFLMWKYLPLVANDFILQRHSHGFILKLILALLFFIWPLFTGGGWAVYPFLIAGFFLVYLDKAEKKITTGLVACCLILSLFYGIGKTLEKNSTDDRFVKNERLYYGILNPDQVSAESLDNEAKIILSYYYYEHRNFNRALSILNSLPLEYRNYLKNDLYGILYFETGNFEQSIQHFRQSLMINEKSPQALKNLALALLKSNQPDQMVNYYKRYPDLEKCRKEIEKTPQGSQVVRIELPRNFLWRKVLALPQSKFHISNFIITFIKGMYWMPMVLYWLIFVFFSKNSRRIFPFLGDSEFCSKCSRILKRKMIEHVHVLCDDCYQLFMVKDIVFFDAKLLKEKEINRKVRRKAIIFYFISILIPGFALNFYEKSKAFAFFAGSTFFLFGYSYYLSTVFRAYFGVVPLFLYVIAIISLLIYLIANLYSLKGIDNGF